MLSIQAKGAKLLRIGEEERGKSFFHSNINFLVRERNNGSTLAVWISQWSSLIYSIDSTDILICSWYDVCLFHNHSSSSYTVVKYKTK